MRKDFNLSRYKELLELEESGKISILDLEFVTYGAIVESQMAYDRKENYFSLIDKYLDRAITPYEFRSKFLEMNYQDSAEAFRMKQDFRKLEGLTLADDLEKFSDVENKLTRLCWEHQVMLDNNTTMEGMSESEFYSLVHNHYLQLQKAFPFNFSEISSNNQGSKNLVYHSFKFLIFIIGLEILLILWSIHTIK